MTKILECSYGDALRLKKAFNNTESVQEWDTLTINEATIELCNSLGIDDQTIDTLKLKSVADGTIAFPVLMYDHIVDVRTYMPNHKPKIKSRSGSVSGAIIPYDILKDTPMNKTILICAGEKDMAVARSNGFQAVTITGGEMALPLTTVPFKDRHIVILYDNDVAGQVGANKLATYLLEFCASVKVCTGFHEICKEDKEDITDFFTKYKGTAQQLAAYMNATPTFTKEDVVTQSHLPLITLQEATTPEYVNKVVRSNIQVVGMHDTQHLAPSVMMAEKIKDAGADDSMRVGDVKDWYMTEVNVQDILHLTDNNFNETIINDNAKRLLKVPPKERWVRITKPEKVVIFKAHVTDMFESMNTDSMPMEYLAYSVGHRLESGKKYTVTHKIVPHPYKGQQLLMIILNAVEANDSVSNFKITDETVANLSVIQNMQGTVEEKINSLTQKVKGMLGYNGNDTLIKCIDLSYHTVLAFHLGQFKNIRGYLDTLIVGESRVGKSSTAETLRKTYQLGMFTSLAGNSATVPGLIGGSAKLASGSFQTKAGLIPQNHKGLVIFEEFGKCNNNLITELTDIRSSNEVRITRVSGTISLPAMVRMIALSNVKASQGEIKPIASYPNGISIVTELVPTAEDIARYDMIAVLGDKGNAQIDPYWVPEEPFDEAVYQTRVRWVWSRTPDQVIISETTGKHIIAVANALNKEYDCHIKIFGTEAWKKISRLAIAVAGYLVSTDKTYTQLIVLPEHVDYAAQLLVELYDNPTFRLKEYVTTERKYSTIDAEGIALLNQQYLKVPQLLLTFEQEAKPTRTMLLASAGLDIVEYNAIMSILIRGSFVRLNGDKVIPTERFRLGMAQITRSSQLRRVGENQC